jgi:hypothetical protein
MTFGTGVFRNTYSSLLLGLNFVLNDCEAMT